MQRSIERSKSCREGEAGYVSCAEARTDHKLAVQLFAPYERSAAYAARLEQERREREEAELRQAELRHAEEEFQRREQGRVRAEEAASAAELDRRLASYRAMTMEARQQTLIDCYRGRLQPLPTSCSAVLAELLVVAASEHERQTLSSTWAGIEAEVDAEIAKLRKQNEAFERQEAQQRAEQRGQSAPTTATVPGLSDAQIRKELIADSLAGYSANCPCPYNSDRAGRRCGKRSAHSRAGGEAPLCFDNDVTPGMIDAFRRSATH